MQKIEAEQGSDEWFALKAGIPSTSAFQKFITPARAALSSRADDYIAQLIVETVCGPQPGYSNEHMRRGLALEDEARSEFELLNFVDVEQTGIILNKGACWSPDGLVVGILNNIAGVHGLEIKCPKPSTHVKWLLQGALPDEHKVQVHGGISVGELDSMIFFSYCPGFRPLQIQVFRDEFTDKVALALAQFLDAYKKALAFVTE